MWQNKAFIFWPAWVTMSKRSTTHGLISLYKFWQSYFFGYRVWINVSQFQKSDAFFICQDIYFHTYSENHNTKISLFLKPRNTKTSFFLFPSKPNFNMCMYVNFMTTVLLLHSFLVLLFWQKTLFSNINWSQFFF